MRVFRGFVVALLALALLPALASAKAPKLSVADAAVDEGGPGAAGILTFDVSLSRKAKKTVKAHYATRDGSAGSSDYEPASGTVKVKRHKRSASVRVHVRAD